MELSQVKLVVADMDGTLLNSRGEVSDRFLDLFKVLKKLDIHFIAASGRQYYSIIDKLDAIKDDITVIAENGGIVKRKEEELLTVCLPLEKTQELIKIMRDIDDAHIVLCGKKKAYVEDKDERFLNIFNEYYYKYELVDDLLQITEDDFFKIAVYSFNGSEATTYPVVSHLEGEIKVKVSGENWLDLSSMAADKGRALALVQKQMRIHKNETMVFGDYNNDLEMLDLAHFSYAMENAHPNVRKATNYKTKSNDALGVELILEELIKAKQEVSFQKQ